MKLTFAEKAWEDYLYWQRTDKKNLKRINTLIKDIKRNPFEGIGDPEPLKYNWSGARISDSPVVEDDDLRVCAASRRITKEHRLIYAVEKDAILIAQCRFHY
ncbi:MAG: Txe/YoeB family addiction module toxin [Cyanobacteria bacterium J06648_1]